MTIVKDPETGKVWPSMKALAASKGVKIGTFRGRINLLGWSLEEALTTPVRPRGAGRAAEPKPDKRSYRITINGVEYSSVCAAAKAHGLSPVTVHARLRHKCTPEQAVRPVSRGTAVVYDGRRFSSKASLAASLGISPNDVEALEGLKYE